MVKSKSTGRKTVRGPERKNPDLGQARQLQRLVDLMAFQSRMPVNPFMDRNEAYDAAGCGPRAAMYIFAH